MPVFILYLVICFLFFLLTHLSSHHTSQCTIFLLLIPLSPNFLFLWKTIFSEKNTCLSLKSWPPLDFPETLEPSVAFLKSIHPSPFRSEADTSHRMSLTATFYHIAYCWALPFPLVSPHFSLHGFYGSLPISDLVLRRIPVPPFSEEV